MAKPDQTAKRRLICRLAALLRCRSQQVTLADIYARYRACGGNRTLDPKILEHLGMIPIAAIDRDFLLVWGRKLYPRLKPHERVRDFVEPLAEILNLPQADLAWWAARRLVPGVITLEEVQAILGPAPPGWRDNPGDADPHNWAEIETRAPRTNDWAATGPIPIPGPPPDPDPNLVADNYPKGGTSRQWEAWDHRGQFSKSRLEDGTQVFPGPTPKGKKSVYARLPNGRSVYIGFVLGKPGRPRKPANAGEAQKPKKAPAKIGRPRPSAPTSSPA